MAIQCTVTTNPKILRGGYGIDIGVTIQTTDMQGYTNVPFKLCLYAGTTPNHGVIDTLCWDTLDSTATYFAWVTVFTSPGETRYIRAEAAGAVAIDSTWAEIIHVQNNQAVVEYSKAGGTGGFIPDPQVVTKGDSIILPPTYDNTHNPMTKYGYVHNSRWISGGVVYSGGSDPITINDDKTFYVHWTPKTWTVTVTSINGFQSGGSVKTRTVYYKELNVDLYDWARSEIDFDFQVTDIKYNHPGTGIPTILDESGEFDNLQITELIIHSTHRLCNVSYVIGSGASLPSGNETTYSSVDRVIQVPKQPSRLGYYFTGWTGPGSYNATNKTFTVNSSTTGDINLTASWSEVEYFIWFYESEEAAEAGIYETQGPIAYSTSVNLRANTFTKPNHQLSGWGLSPDGEVEFLDQESISQLNPYHGGVVELFALWELQDFTVTFQLNDGTSGSFTQTVKYGSQITAPTPPTRTGYTFSGWKMGSQSVTWPITVTSDLTLTATWIPIEYTISYTLNGGTHSGNPIKYTIESETINLNVPSKVGYNVGSWSDGGKITKGSTGNKTFVASYSSPIVYTITYQMSKSGTTHTNPTGYTIEDDIIITAGTLLGYDVTWDVAKIHLGSTGNRTITAQYTVKTYTINYVLNGGSNPTGNPTTYTIESNFITLATPVRTGYAGVWSNGGTIPTGSTGNKTFTASYTLIEYSINYILNGGIHSGNPIKYTIETPTITLNVPSKVGYENGTWSGGGKIEQGSTGNKTFTASYTPITYSITYVLNGGSCVSPVTEYTIETETFNLPNVSRTGYTGVWKNSQNETVTQVNKGTYGNLTFTAHWTVVTYNITYVLNGGSNPTGNPTNYNIETPTVTLSPPVKTGYQGSWSPDGGVIQIGSTGNKTFTASYTAVAYSITYELDGGVNALQNPAGFDVEDLPITLAPATKNGYSFQGWKLNGEFVTTIPTGTTTNVTLTAVFQIIQYTIHYVMNGGVNPSGNPTVYTVNSPTITLQVPTKTGYQGSWLGGGIIPTGSVGNKTFTAKYVANKYKVIFNKNSNLATGTMTDQEFTYDQADNLKAIGFTRPQYRFLGWSKTKTGNVVYSDQQLVSNLTSTNNATYTVYAQWECVKIRLEGSGSIEIKFENNTVGKIYYEGIVVWDKNPED